MTARGYPIKIPRGLRSKAWLFVKQNPIENSLTLPEGITPEQLFIGKLGEIGARLFFGFTMSGLFIAGPDGGYDITIPVAGAILDVKAHYIGHHLIWPCTKNAEYFDDKRRPFTHLMSVSIDKKNSSTVFVDGVISKAMFAQAKRVATVNDSTGLKVGTWLLPKEAEHHLQKIDGDTFDQRTANLAAIVANEAGKKVVKPPQEKRGQRQPAASTIDAYWWLIKFSGQPKSYIDSWLDDHPLDAPYLRNLKPRG